MESKKKFLIDRWLESFCEPWLYEGIRGDLEELYDTEVREKGALRARIYYNLRTIGFFRLAFYRKTKMRKANFETMWRNYFIITLRNLKKHKAYSFINILGLTIGMTVGFIILQYVYYEATYDQFFENKENIYRIRTDRYEKGELSSQWASGASGAGITLWEEFPEVLAYVKLKQEGQALVRENDYFKVDYGFYATYNLFQEFSISVIRGNDSTILSGLYKAALCESMAYKMFGSEDPIGKEIKTNDGMVFVVSGVFEDLPEKSHFKMEVLYSMQTLLLLIDDPEADYSYNWDGWLNYIVLRDGTDPKKLEEKIPDFIRNKADSGQLDNFAANTNFVLQPLTDIHLTSDYEMEIKETGNAAAIYLLLVIGMFVLFIAWINYINLTTARSLSRAKEVGVRKVLGSYKSQLLKQFLFESAFTNFLAFMIAAVLVLIIYPYFNDFIDRSEAYTWPDAGWFWLCFGLLSIFGILLSGFYPALVLSGFKPIVALKGRFISSSKGSIMRQGLVVSQFFISIVLITATYIVYTQLAYLMGQELGIKLDQTLVIKSNRNYNDSVSIMPYQVFKNTVLEESGVSGFSTSTSVPGRPIQWNVGGIRLIHETEDKEKQYRVIEMDDQYIDLFGIEIIAGRGFDHTFGNEKANVLCSETAMRQLGFNNPNTILNQKIHLWDTAMNIIGVFKDHRHESPKVNYEPVLFGYVGNDLPQWVYSIRINADNLKGTLEKIRGHWKDVYGERPFNFFFLNDHYDKQYQAELRFGSIFGIFSGLAIFVACLGLFGLTSYISGLRMKEASIRKVMGASFGQLWLLLTGDFVKLVGLAIVIAILPTWYIMQKWLDNFASRIDLSWWLFLLPAAILLIIAVSTTSYHTFSTANANPTRTLKGE